MVAARLDCAVVVMKRLIIAFALAFGLGASPASAGFLDWWLTPDQQGRLFIQRGDYQQAARMFEDPDWKAQAFYMAGDFANAAALYAKMDTPEGKFRLGNALAKQEKLDEAIAAYQQALEMKPEFPEATFNLDWVTGLKELDDKEYDDAGGTGGALRADRTVFDDKADNAVGEVSKEQFQSQGGLSDAQMQDMWMERVQTTPADFLQFKFAYQLNQQNQEAAE